MISRSSLVPAAIRAHLWGLGACIPLALLLSRLAWADCIDYGTYFRWLGEVNAPPALNVAASGTHLFAASSYGLLVVDASDPSTPYIAAQIDSLRFYQLATDGDRLYANGYAGITIFDLSVPTAPLVVGTIPKFGLPVPSGDRLLVSSDTLWVYDVSDPRSPAALGSLDLPGTTRGAVTNGQYACVAGTGEATDLLDTLAVVQVSDPRHPTLTGGLALPGTVYALTLQGTYAYLGVDTTLVVVSLSDPTSPHIVGELPLSRLVLDIDVSGSVGVVGILSGLATVDLSDPPHPKLVDSIPLLPNYPGWVRVAASPSRHFVNILFSGGNCPSCESYSTIRVLEPAGGSRPPRVANIQTQGFAWGATALGNFLYVPADVAGLEILDASNPLEPSLLATLDTPGEAIDVAVRGSVAVVADDPDIVVADVSDPRAPSILAVLPNLSGARAVALADTIAFVACGMFGLLAVDVSQPSSPLILGSIHTPYYASDVALAGNYAYVTDRAYGLFVVDVSNPRAPNIVGSLDTPGNAMSIAVEDPLAFIADDTSVQVINISAPSSPSFLGSTGTPGSARGIAAQGTDVYVADIYSGLAVIDVSTPTMPRVIGGDQSFAHSFAVSVADHVYLGDGWGGVHVFPLDCSGMTDVRLNEFTALSQPEGIMLHWQAPGGDWAGFYPERSRYVDRDYVRITTGLTTEAQFLDRQVAPGVTYFYRLEGLDRSGGSTYFAPISASFDPPVRQTHLGPNHPNPFPVGGVTTITFSLSREEHVRLRILDVSGRSFRSLLDGTPGAGWHDVPWDGRDDRGRAVPPGVYFLQLETREGADTRKLILLP